MKPIPIKTNPNQNKPRLRGKNRTAPQPTTTPNQEHNDRGLTDVEISSLMSMKKNPQAVKENTAMIIQTWAMKKFGQNSQQPPANTNMGNVNMELEDMNPPMSQPNV